MNELAKIKNHVDAHGVGCAIVDDHVVIDVVWTSRTISGAERRREMTERVTSLEEAARVLGCRCVAAAISA
jgi:hypothetical protein